ncbi:hypothetical protein BCO18175_02340 [Burkholderia contaminans]|uniref:hypothetical protein n=1 Tax=Burkholderia TaxID=32008 RepID=UPI000CE1FFB4|nr:MULTISPECIES: hypothetical protein [Burkholderia]ELK6464644.1 hypothetical protein [Burkholderia contaminans]RQX81814.1 hypothetical protein DF034_17515 [Burkholderia anthina]VWC75625.1 hypothetical protein BCO18175_02340 [Burkholderia contaminans]
MTIYTFVVTGITDQNEASVAQTLSGIAGFVRLSRIGVGEYILVFESSLDEHATLAHIQQYLPAGVVVRPTTTIKDTPSKKFGYKG